MSLIQKAADKLFIQPTTGAIDTEHRIRKLISFDGEQLEAWTQKIGDKADPDLLVLKFIGAGGRAEKSGPHPIETWGDITAEVWAINPLGYGGSTGKASVQSFAAMAIAAHDAMVAEFPGKKMLVIGNSIGSAPALYLATHRPIDGLFTRNPPPIRELVIGRYSWWNFGIGSRIIASRFPEQLDSIDNASKTKTPALFVMSMADTLVPIKYQHMIIDNYAGPKKIFRSVNANHDDPPDESQLDEYLSHLHWLRDQCMMR